jgi:hypothetical protein
VLIFLVLRPHKHHSICLYVNQSICNVIQSLTLGPCSAVHTYNGKGTASRHIRARDHVIIYSGDRPPKPLPDEDRAALERREPIKVKLDPKGEKLKAASRLNLSKFYTFEHNIPIFPVGRISSLDVDNVKRYCAEVQGLLLVPADMQSLPEEEEEEGGGEDEEEDEDEDDEDEEDEEDDDDDDDDE